MSTVLRSIALPCYETVTDLKCSGEYKMAMCRRRISIYRQVNQRKVCSLISMSQMEGSKL